MFFFLGKKRPEKRGIVLQRLFCHALRNSTFYKEQFTQPLEIDINVGKKTQKLYWPEKLPFAK